LLLYCQIKYAYKTLIDSESSSFLLLVLNSKNDFTMSAEKFDRRVFKYQSAKEAFLPLKYSQTQSYEKRLETANYLNSVAYNSDINNPS